MIVTTQTSVVNCRCGCSCGDVVRERFDYIAWIPPDYRRLEAKVVECAVLRGMGVPMVSKKSCTCWPVEVVILPTSGWSLELLN